MVEYLKKNGIKSINSSASVIRVQYEGNNNFEYNRKKDISKIGYILTDGLKKPKILFGVYTGIDLMFELQSYFDINK
jgi:hypothetical protein